MDFNQLADFESLEIRVASPDDIKSWSHGEVTKPETINYRTLKSEKDGLFCEKIFGPTKDWQCYCGKYKGIRYKGVICDKCGVEVTQSRVRRERMGHINLACPVAHVWFFKGTHSKLSLLLDISPKSLESVVYFAQYVVLSADETKREETVKLLEENLSSTVEQIKKNMEERLAQIEVDQEATSEDLKRKVKNQDQLTIALQELQLKTKKLMQATRDQAVVDEDKGRELYKRLQSIVKQLNSRSLLTEDEYVKLLEYNAADFFEVGMGAEAVIELVKKLDLKAMYGELKQDVDKSVSAKRLKAIKRLKIVKGMIEADINPVWMIMTILPVLPPDLRPMVQLSGGRFATSDLNDLYRRVINRNNRLHHLIELGAPEIILRNEKRMLQEAVDSLYDAPQRNLTTRRQRRVLRSLSEMLKGKQGRFRQNLLGKRVDYSGRSVIVVGPNLRLDQCGLPKDMALEMFKPFVLRQMILRGLAPNVKSAKNILERRPPEVFDILEEITSKHPVLLNRAPTLHKLSIQAFYPILIEGNAISLHPCVCDAYNADFDGDQMAVHIPLSKVARQEASDLMTPVNNLLRPADGVPITVPAKKEIALGTYYLTSLDDMIKPHEGLFGTTAEVITAYQNGRVAMRQLVTVRINGEFVETTVGRIMFNEVLPQPLQYVNEPIRQTTVKDLFSRALKICDKSEIADMIDNIKHLGFQAGTLSGLSLSINDCQLLPEKDEIIESANKEVSEIEENYSMGLTTNVERKRLTQEVWIRTTEELADKTWNAFDNDNPIKLVIDAKVGRVSRDNIKQLSAMRGLVVDPNGNIIEMPTKSNYREGLTIFEYVTAARGGRKGLTDTAIKTADAGYLTRRLVDVGHDMIIRIEDCGVEEGLEILRATRPNTFGYRILGRYVANEVVNAKGEVICDTNTIVDEVIANLIQESDVASVTVRSPLTCKSKHGLCAKCYGWDLSDREAADLGTPVGVLAAQSIGEPGTQLTMRTKHSAGVVGTDVTQGLPRVEELFEARSPKVPSPISEIAGTVSINETETGFEITVENKTVKPAEVKVYSAPLSSKLLVENGQTVQEGTALVTGSLDLKEILRIQGLHKVQTYLVEQLQAVYESQGITIHDKHFEVVVRRITDRVRIHTAGDTKFLIGDLIDRVSFEVENQRVIAEGGEPATGEMTILGITRMALNADNSWLSAASFQHTTQVLSEAAVRGSKDPLLGLKENVIIGRLIPTSPERAVIQ